MVDEERVCCLCGDVGFPDKLFHCSRCRFRFQHSYCSNYYNGSMESSSSSMCDWCHSEVGGSQNGVISNTSNSNRNKSSSVDYNSSKYIHIRSEYTSGERIKHQHQQHQEQQDHNQIKVPSSNTSNKNSGSGSGTGVPSPRPNAHRRYKLLKDVMC